MRHAIQTALVLNAHEPQFLLIEYGADGAGRCVGAFHNLGGAIEYAHERQKWQRDMEAGADAAEADAAKASPGRIALHAALTAPR